MNLRWQISVVSLLFAATQAWAAAAPQCLDVFAARGSNQKLYEQVQAQLETHSQALANQADYDNLIRNGGGGACASSAAFNLLVGLQRMAGVTKLLAASQVLADAFQKQPVLLNGRVSNSQLLDLMRYFRQYLGRDQLITQIDRSIRHRDEWEEKEDDGAHTWTDFDDRILKAQDREIKLLTYRVTTAEGVLLGRHFVVLLDFDPRTRQVSVLDSNRPNRIFKYLLKTVPEASGETVELVRLAGKSDLNNRLDTVFTYRLAP